MSDGPAKAAALIWTTLPDDASARAIAETLLEEQLIACANIFPGHRAIFVWQGEPDEADEVGVLFKLSAHRLDAAITRLTALHPYETPAILGWRCDAAAPATFAWLGA